MIDQQMHIALQKASMNLKYVQLDVMLSIASSKLFIKCRKGALQLNATVDAERESDGASMEWERNVVFEIVAQSRTLVAEVAT